MSEILSTFKEQYQILMTLGKSCKAKVKKVKERKSGKLFAVKIIPKNNMDEEEKEILKS